MNVELWILVFTAVVATAATIAAWFAAFQTRKSSLGQMLAQLISIYGSTEMLNSLILLREFKKRVGEDFASILARNLHGKSISDYESEVNASRSTVFTFYETVRVLEKRKILTFEKDISEIIGRHAVGIFFEIVEPMEYEMAKIEDRKYFNNTFDKFREWYPNVSNKYPNPF